MLQSKPRRPRRPTKLEKALEQVARLMADREAASVPWPQLQEVRENYVAWEALTLWVRAIEDVEGSLPRCSRRLLKDAVRASRNSLPSGSSNVPIALPSGMTSRAGSTSPFFTSPGKKVGWMRWDTMQRAIWPPCATMLTGNIVSASGSSQSLLLIPLSATGLKPRSSVTTRRSTSAKCARRSAD